MNEMIERAAKAAKEVLDNLHDLNNYPAYIDDIAKAIIKSMREPTEEMINLQTDTNGMSFANAEDMRNIWQSMIDEILK